MNPITDKNKADVQVMLAKLLEIYDVKALVAHLSGVGENHWSPAIFKRMVANEAWHRLNDCELIHPNTLLPKPSTHRLHYAFRFIDLFAGIGGIRRGFGAISGQCVFTSEWDKHVVRTYKANNYYDPLQHRFNKSIRDIILNHHDGVSDQQAAEYIRQHIPEHDVLLARFPYQPFFLAGVSKKSALGRVHGFACDTQGTLFFDVVRIIDVCRPATFVLENVKNLKSHDQGKTFRITMQTLDELGYDMAGTADDGPDDLKTIDGQHFLPQHHERIVLAGFRRDLNLKSDLTLRDIVARYSQRRTTLAEPLKPTVGAEYILTPVLWKYLYRYAKKYRARGNGFGYGMVYPDNPDSVTCTLSAHCYRDGAEVLIDRGWDMALDERDFDDPQNRRHRPRRLTPRECARLMGFGSPQGYQFRIPVSDTQIYRQFDSSVVIPAFAAVARLLEPKIRQAVAIREKENQRGRRSR